MNENLDSTNETPLDLSALDPTRDTARFHGIAAGIARDAMRARESRGAERDDLFGGLTRWWIPTLAAAGLVLAVALPMLSKSAPAPVVVQRTSSADILGIPSALVDLLRSNQVPSIAELQAALGTTTMSTP